MRFPVQKVFVPLFYQDAFQISRYAFFSRGVVLWRYILLLFGSAVLGCQKDYRTDSADADYNGYNDTDYV